MTNHFPGLVQIKNDKIGQLFSLGTPVSSTNSTDCHNITEILLKVVLNTIRTGFELTTIVVIGTDCTGSCKSNYHTITTTTAPFEYRYAVLWNIDNAKVYSIQHYVIKFFSDLQ
jgi:ketosteroid isomerase-like protein